MAPEQGIIFGVLVDDRSSVINIMHGFDTRRSEHIKTPNGKQDEEKNMSKLKERTRKQTNMIIHKILFV